MQSSDYIMWHCTGSVLPGIKHFSTTVPRFQSMTIFLNYSDHKQRNIFKYPMLADAADMVAFSDIAYIFKLFFFFKLTAQEILDSSSCVFCDSLGRAALFQPAAYSLPPSSIPQ